MYLLYSEESILCTEWVVFTLENQILFEKAWNS